MQAGRVVISATNAAAKAAITASLAARCRRIRPSCLCVSKAAQPSRHSLAYRAHHYFLSPFGHDFCFIVESQMIDRYQAAITKRRRADVTSPARRHRLERITRFPARTGYRVAAHKLRADAQMMQTRV